MKSAIYLDQVKTKLGLHADQQLAEYFNVTKAAISQLKSGKRIMENEMCLAVALALEIDPLKVIMAADIDRAERAGQRSLWAVFSQRMAAAASVVAVIGVTGILTPENAEARTYAPHSDANRPTNLYYVKYSMWQKGRQSSLPAARYECTSDLAAANQAEHPCSQTQQRQAGRFRCVTRRWRTRAD